MERRIQRVEAPQDVGEGTGAHMKRLFPNRLLAPFDPFVLLDEFFVPPEAGLPEHPHKGFEIITYMLSGGLQHKDSLDVDHTARAGGLMRISAGRGILHSEFPAGGKLAHGLQLWVNLAQERKEMEPSFAAVPAAEVPEEKDDGIMVRLIAGKDARIQLETPVIYRHVRMAAGRVWTHDVPPEYAGFIYVLEGAVAAGPADAAREGAAAHGLFMTAGADQGETVRVAAHETHGADFVLIMGRPHGELIRLRGPFVL